MNGALNLHPKVTASALGGSVTTLILYSLDHWAHLSPPVFVAAALEVVVMFGCGYLAPDSYPTTTLPPAS
jgi:hypothetical protein